MTSPGDSQLTLDKQISIIKGRKVTIWESPVRRQPSADVTSLLRHRPTVHDTDLRGASSIFAKKLFASS